MNSSLCLSLHIKKYYSCLTLTNSWMISIWNSETGTRQICRKDFTFRYVMLQLIVQLLAYAGRFILSFVLFYIASRVLMSLFATSKLFWIHQNNGENIRQRFQNRWELLKNHLNQRKLLHLWLRERMMKKKIKEQVSQDKEGGFDIAWNLQNNASLWYVEKHSSGDNVLPFT